MPLVSFEPETDLSSTTSDVSFSAHIGQSMSKCFKPNGLDLLMDKIDPNACIHYISDGSWSQYDLLIRALDQYDRCMNVWITTYSMTELSARVLAKLKDSGKIRKLHLLMDYKSKQRYPQVYQLLINVADEICFTQIHAKVLLIENGKEGMTVLGSANWTKNPRIEAGIIDTNYHVAMNHLSWIQQIMNDGRNH